MKIGFWTLLQVDADWPNERIAREAAARGYHGVDLRVARTDGLETLGANVRLDSDAAEIQRIRAAYADAGVEIASLNCYNGSPRASDDAKWLDYRDSLERHADLAVALGTTRVRYVVEGPAADLAWPGYLLRAWETIGAVLDRHPTLDAVVENHPGRASARQLLETAEKAGDDRIGVEFSPDHALVMQEDIGELIERYCRHIHHVCYADRRLVEEGLGDFDGRFYSIRYESCFPGEGNVPTERMIERLREGGFDDYISLKYERSSTYGLHLPPGTKAFDEFPAFLARYGVAPARS